MLENNILKCYTAKHKLVEARYFLTLLEKPEIWNDDEKISFYFNAFILAAGSVTDYVNADFIYHGITPRIKWIEYEIPEKKKEIIANHKEKESIEKFRSKYANEMDKLLRQPIANYFRLKRNKITHIHWDVSRYGTFTENDNVKIFDIRCFEGFDPNYYKKTRGQIPLDLFDERINESDKETTLLRLNEENIIDISNEYLELLDKFIKQFEGMKFQLTQNDSSF